MKKCLYKILILCLSIGFFACEDEKPQQELPRLIATGNPAIDGITPRILTNPTDPTLYAQRAAAYYDMEGYDEAIADMRMAIQLDSTNIEYHYLLSDIYLDYLKSQAALVALERAVALDPKNIRSLLKLAELQLILKQHDNSVKSVDQILKIDNLNADAYYLMGMNFEQTGDNARAINSYQTAIENDPKMADAHLKLGLLFAQEGNEIAVRYFDNAIAVEPDNLLPLYAKAEYLHNNDRLDEALELLREAISRDRLFMDAYFRSGVIYLEKDSLQKAYDQFNIIVESDPTNALGYYYRGLSSELKGQVGNAKNDYEQALAFSPNYAKAKEALNRLNGTE